MEKVFCYDTIYFHSEMYLKRISRFFFKINNIAENWVLGEESTLHVRRPVWPWSIWERNIGERKMYIIVLLEIDIQQLW